MSKKTILITETQVQQMVENIVAKANGEEVNNTINESVITEKPKKKRIVKINESDFKRMLIDLSKKVGNNK